MGLDERLVVFESVILNLSEAFREYVDGGIRQRIIRERR
jgi:hypothetical protein